MLAAALAIRLEGSPKQARRRWPARRPRDRPLPRSAPCFVSSVRTAGFRAFFKSFFHPFEISHFFYVNSRLRSEPRISRGFGRRARGRAQPRVRARCFQLRRLCRLGRYGRLKWHFLTFLPSYAEVRRLPSPPVRASPGIRRGVRGFAVLLFHEHLQSTFDCGGTSLPFRCFGFRRSIAAKH